jgi:hypothetical protein
MLRIGAASTATMGSVPFRFQNTLWKSAQSTADLNVKQIVSVGPADRTSRFGEESARASSTHHISATRRSASGPFNAFNSKLEGALFARVAIAGIKFTAHPPPPIVWRRCQT